MFWRDHNPPHFHALYGEYEAVFDVRDLRVLRGSLPRRAMGLVLEWASDHRDELMEAGIYAANSNLQSQSIP